MNFYVDEKCQFLLIKINDSRSGGGRTTVRVEEFGTFSYIELNYALEISLRNKYILSIFTPIPFSTP